jgi:hypothetical protein
MEWQRFGILTLLHALVLTESANWAVFRVTLDVYGSVDAGGVVITGVIWSALARQEVQRF